jgi:2-polyprenyl-6-methoxyphenol hydroxylase-like FAD-dependent oxidoreductase
MPAASRPDATRTSTAGPPPPERVLIVGGGPVGLGAALELARFGVPSILLEQREGTSWHPKTRNFNTRTMEIARNWGAVVYERLRAVDTPPGWKSPIRFMTSVVGEQIGEIESKGFEGPGPGVSPALPVMSSQDLFEEILCDACIASGGVDLRFGHRVTDVLVGGRDGDLRAIVTVEDGSGSRYELEGAALVGADGIDSLVRERLGIELIGEKALHYFINCYFRADIERYVGERSGVLLFVANQGAGGVLQPLDARGRWLCQIAVTRENWDPDVFTAERVRDWVRAAVGVDDLPVEVLSVGRWRMNVAVAERFVQGRIVLCGDAAHQFPPTGGLGVNTGLQGMHNAMWKLALCVQGRADWQLLESYDDERREPSKTTAEQSLENHRNVALIAAGAYGGDEDTISTEERIRTARRYGNHLGVEFGTYYESCAVIADGSTPPEVADRYSDYIASATPGCRAPHVWLEEGRLSTLDLLGAGFTLLCGPDGQTWRTQATEASEQLQLPIAVYTIGTSGLTGADQIFLEAYGIDRGGAVLVRPDGYVAWRAPGSPGPGDDAQLLEGLRQILGGDRVSAR